MDDKQFAEITKAMGREMTRRGALGRLTAGLVAAAGLSRFDVFSAKAASVEPVQYPQGRQGDCPPTSLSNEAADVCSCLGYSHGFKDDLIVDDTKQGVAWNYHDGNTLVDWSATKPIGAVVVKASTENLVYEYPGGATSDTDLYAPEHKTISHVIYCWNDALEVSKTADTSYDRDFDWKIAKSVAPKSMTLATGQIQTANYSVEVTRSEAQDDNFAVSGTITIKNPNSSAATISRITDVITQGAQHINADSLECKDEAGDPVSLPTVDATYSLAGGAKLTCIYSAQLESNTDGTNKATVKTTGKVPGGSGTAPVNFAQPTNVTDRCVKVTDLLPDGTVDTLDNELCASKTFTYSHDVGPYAECGTDTVTNTAAFKSNDTDETGSSSATVNVSIPCNGCTLTQGYWKTHSRRGPAPYDNAWKALGEKEENTPFFNSGLSYYEVLKTPPAGNPYFTLAHQYIAAELNILNGANGSAVTNQMASAKALFEAVANGTTLTNAQQTKAKNLVSALDKFNNGETGPGHCTERTTSQSSSTASARQKVRKGGNARNGGKN